MLKPFPQQDRVKGPLVHPLSGVAEAEGAGTTAEVAACRLISVDGLPTGLEFVSLK
jgi:hypothetical protein